jgi:hypothetical protein
MNKRMLFVSLALILATLGCNLPSNAVPTTTPTSIFPTQTATPLFTATPTLTLTPTVEPTPAIPIAWPSDKGVNCRLGPSTDWVTIGALLVGETATIQGKNGDASWWYVVTKGNPGTPCWVAASVTITAGNLANLPIINPPVASVTDVKLTLDPKDISLPGCIGPVQPIKFEGTISVNGPVKVKWYFETQQDGAESTDTLNFNFADSKKVESSSFSPDPVEGTFWVRLVVVEPNNKVAEAKYKIECP